MNSAIDNIVNIRLHLYHRPSLLCITEQFEISLMIYLKFIYFCFKLFPPNCHPNKACCSVLLLPSSLDIVRTSVAA